MRNTFNAASPYKRLDTMKDGEILHIPTGTNVTKEDMMEAVSEARVIYISENHDNLAAHEAQLDVIRELHKKHPGKIAVGMEMFRRSAQKELDSASEGKMTRDGFNKLFDREWTADWRAAYQPVLDYLYDKKIPVIGLKPTTATESAVRSGNTSPDVPELDMNDPHHRGRYLPFFSGANTTPEAAEKKYRMMVLWDEAMAERVAEFLKNPANKDKKLVVIAGVGHIGHGYGIPKRAYRRKPHSYSIIVPAVGHEADGPTQLPLGDYAWKVPYKRTAQPPRPPSAPRGNIR